MPNPRAEAVARGLMIGRTPEATRMRLDLLARNRRLRVAADRVRREVLDG